MNTPTPTMPPDLTASIQSMTATEFGIYLGAIPAATIPPVLRARFAAHIDDFFRFCVAPALKRQGQRVEAPGRLHREVWGRLSVPVADRRGISTTLIVAPRGVSKSTTTRVYALHAYLHGSEQGILFIGPQRADAVAASMQIQEWLAEPEIQLVYGPSRIGGVQTCWYDPTRAIPVWARGWDSALRGVIQHAIRPTLIIADDIETERNTRSEDAVETTLAKMSGAVLNLGPIQGGAHIVWIATPVSPTCAVARAIDGSDDRLRSWDVIRLPAVLRPPDPAHDPLWARAKDIYTSATGTEVDRWSAARKFISENPRMKRPSVVLSTRLPVQECYRRRWQIGEAAYHREIMVSPAASAGRIFDTAVWPRHTVAPAPVIYRGTKSWAIHPLTDPDPSQRQQAHLSGPLPLIGPIDITYDPSDGGDDGAVIVSGAAPPTTGDIMYVLEMIALRKMTAIAQVDAVAKLVTKWSVSAQPVHLRYEQNLMTSLLRDALTSAIHTATTASGSTGAARNIHLIPYLSTERKERRIASLAGPADTGRISIPLGVGAYETRMIDSFDPTLRGQRDDIPDVLHAAYARHAERIGGKTRSRGDGSRAIVPLG